MTQSGSREPPIGRGGVRVFDDRRARRAERVRLAVALLAVLATVVLVLRTMTGVFGPEPPAQGPRPPSTRAADAPTVAARRAVPPTPSTPRRRADAVDADHPGGPISRREPARPPTPAPAAVPPRPPDAPASDEPAPGGLLDEVLESLRTHGAPTGIAVYPPKGTNPPKTGIVVPDDFQLPEGYVRYYQITDEGRRLEPILMFSPDYEFVDDHGNVVPLPESGIVPPEMAPPGMPIRTLELPAETQPGPHPR